MQNKQKNIKIAIIGCISLILLIIVLLLIPQPATVVDENSVMPSAPTTNMIFYNSYELIYSIGDSCTTEALDQIRSSIEENIDVPSIATIEEKSFTKISQQPEVYSFSINVDDGRIYQAYVRLDSEQNDDDFLHTTSVSTYVKRSGSDEYVFHTSALNPDLQQTLTEWAAAL